ncbi:MAG: hypothetical protein Q9173_000434 [Seirophora scorigena]
MRQTMKDYLVSTSWKGPKSPDGHGIAYYSLENVLEWCQPTPPGVRESQGWYLDPTELSAYIARLFERQQTSQGGEITIFGNGHLTDQKYSNELAVVPMRFRCKLSGGIMLYILCESRRSQQQNLKLREQEPMKAELPPSSKSGHSSESNLDIKGTQPYSTEPSCQWMQEYGRIAVVPSVNLACSDEIGKEIKASKGYVINFVDNGDEKDEKEWQEKPPEKAKCINGWKDEYWVPGAQNSTGRSANQSQLPSVGFPAAGKQR